jgi:hypothetical protein
MLVRQDFRDTPLQAWGCLLVALPIALALLLLPPAELVRDVTQLRRATAVGTARVEDVQVVRTSKRAVLRRDVTYSFSTGGRRYVGEHGGEGFSLGAEVPVYYDPGDPSVSFLTRGVRPSTVGLTLLAWGVVLMGVLLARVPHGRDLLHLRYVPALALPLWGAVVFATTFRTGRVPWADAWIVPAWAAGSLAFVGVLVVRYRWRTKTAGPAAWPRRP